MKKIITIIEFENGFVTPLKYMSKYQGGITKTEFKSLIPEEDIEVIEIRTLKLIKTETYGEYFNEKN